MRQAVFVKIVWFGRAVVACSPPSMQPFMAADNVFFLRRLRLVLLSHLRPEADGCLAIDGPGLLAVGCLLADEQTVKQQVRICK